VSLALESGQHYNLFIYDKFSLSEDDLATLAHLARSPAIEQFLLVGSFTEVQRREMMEWAWQQHVPLLQMLERPFSLGQMRSVIASLVDYADAEQGCFPFAFPLLTDEVSAPPAFRSAAGRSEAARQARPATAAAPAADEERGVCP